jgi:PKD repeat protein
VTMKRLEPGGMVLPSNVLRIALMAGVLAASAVFPPAALADAGDIGVEGPSYAGAAANPTGEKPESKAWFNDGSWWASMWDTASGRYEIFRFAASSQTWSSTNVALDGRANSRADTLWDGSKLYVASHVFSKTPASGYPSYLYRFSYSASTDAYTLDAGWPQQINNHRSESLVIDKDSTGQIWATWVQGSSGSRRVYVNRTTNGDATWGTPFELPVSGVAVADDDISSVIAFGGNKVGVFWSNQKGSSFHFAVHDDAAADTSWGSSVGVYPGAGNADDHINLKSLHTDGSGRVFAVVKTSRTGSDPSIVLLVRSTSAVWNAHTVWTRNHDLTRPIILIDTTQSRIHAFASKEGGGPVYTKVSDLSSISFGSGLGTTVMLDASHNDINDATSTKANVSSASGLLVLASNQATRRYWHHYNPLGGSPPPPGQAPVANFTAAPRTGEAPLAVSFTDTSTNAPTSWAWSFGDGGTSNQQHPSHSYGAPGSYTVTLTVSNAHGSDSETRAGYITVTQPGGGGGSLTFTPTDDTFVSSGTPTTVNGDLLHVRARSGSPQVQAYFKFTVTASGSPQSAVLRLWVIDPSPDGGSLFLVPDNSWSEGTMTWQTREPTTGSALDSAGAVSLSTWVSFDVSSVVTGDGTYSFALISNSTDVVRYSSSEASAANRPQLIVTP